MEESNFYHIYNRGVDKRSVFEDPKDFQYMLDLFNRYLSPGTKFNQHYYRYPNFTDSLSLVAFCLMPNHFHMLIEEYEVGSVAKFMQSLKTAYDKYFNLKYERSGFLFESRYHHRLIQNESDWLHISRYIHLNPLALTQRYEKYPYSSLRYILDRTPPSWLKIQQITDSFSGPGDYLNFHEDYIRKLAIEKIETVNV